LAYRKLRTSRNGFGSSSRLYLGPDHILSVESDLFTEKYYRFYFTDIQAIIVQKTDRGAIWSILLGCLALLTTTCSIGAIPPGEWTPTPGYFILALAALTIMIVNLVKGPTCKTFFQTSVTVQKVGALHRQKKTEQILPEIRSQIRVVQGSLTREQIERETVMPEEEITTGPDQWRADHSHEHEPSNRVAEAYHKFAFGMVLVNAGFNALWMFVQGLTVYVIGGLSAMAGFCGIVAALIVQTGRNTTSTVRKLTWGVFASYLAVFFMSYSLGIYYSISSGMRQAAEGKGFDPFSFYTNLVEMGPEGKPGLYVLVVFSIGLYAFLGISGLAAVRRKERQKSSTGTGGRTG
jgi:hypothetical protein